MLTTLVSGLFITLQHVKSVWDVLTAVHLRYSFTDYFILLLLDGKCFRLWQLYGLKFRTLVSLRGVWAEEVSLCNWVIKCVHSWTSLKENELVIRASATKKGCQRADKRGDQTVDFYMGECCLFLGILPQPLRSFQLNQNHNVSLNITKSEL